MIGGLGIKSESLEDSDKIGPIELTGYLSDKSSAGSSASCYEKFNRKELNFIFWIFRKVMNATLLQLSEKELIQTA